MKSFAVLAMALACVAAEPAVDKIAVMNTAEEYALLGDLVPTMKTVGWAGYWVDRSWYATGFQIAGSHYKNGVFAHAPSNIEYDLEKKYAYFSGCVGLEDGNKKRCGDGARVSVVADGRTLFSTSVYKLKRARCFRVSVKNVRKLALVASSGRSKTCDQVAWVNTKMFEDPIVDCYQLGSLMPTYKSVGWGNFWVNRNWYRKGFLINRRRYPSGIYTHTPSNVHYNLHGAFATFEACAGIDDGACKGGKSTFVVRTDRKMRFAANMKKGQSARCFRVSVKGAKSLALSTHGTKRCGHSEWVNAHVCKIRSRAKANCVTSAWSTWTKCSRTCGTGYSSRSRTIVRSPSAGGKRCGQTDAIQKCNTKKCPVDCIVTEWTRWSSCSRKCLGGMRTRRRSVRRDSVFGGKKCPKTIQSQVCNTKKCPVACKVTGWSKWSKCSRSCGTGYQRQFRSISRIASNGGASCPTLVKHSKCNTNACPTDCVYTAFSKWTKCSRTCGGGYQNMRRSVSIRGRWGGRRCPHLVKYRRCANVQCPIDCEVTAHGSWTKCTRSCGEGKQSQHRSITVNNAYGGRTCPKLTRFRACGTKKCPIDCAFTKFGTYSQCSKSCGTGKQWRGRSMLKPRKFGGKKCPHMNEERPCNTHACPVNCVVGRKNAWQKCSRTCGRGHQKRTLTMVTNSKFGGKACPQMFESRDCNTQNCPVDCIIGKWTKASKCTKSCGNGWRHHRRNILVNSRYGGKSCPNTDAKTACNTQPCPIDCKMSKWTFTRCSRTCGTGIKKARRSVVRARLFGGKHCGQPYMHKPCHNKKCARDCRMTTWSKWTECSKTCGLGSKIRLRTIHMLPAFGGKKCLGTTQYRKCSFGRCPVSCKVSKWGKYSKCTKSCGKGHMIRHRKIVKKGKNSVCPYTREQKLCGDITCPSDCRLSPFSGFTRCSARCGGGFQHKKRVVVRKAIYGGKPCKNLVAYRQCNTKACKIDCAYTKWSKSSFCSRTCGIGRKFRVRSITIQASFGGKPCGQLKRVTSCKTANCPTDCVVSSWNAYGKCSKACGSGKQMRYRSVLQAANGGKKCPGLKQAHKCNTFSCKRHCAVSNWGSWGKCSRSCGGKGLRIQRRKVVRYARSGGNDCPILSRTQPCKGAPCPIHCQVTAWSKFTKCTKTCGTGRMTQTRKIVQKALYKGRVCPTLKNVQKCGLRFCKVHCRQTAWKQYKKCSRSCGTGTQKSYRKTLTTGKYGGKRCGATVRVRLCKRQACPVDCRLTSWGQWRPCSKTCGGGWSTRVRGVSVASEFGGKKCNALTAKRSCALKPCPVDCVVGDFSLYTPCTKSCGGGVQARYRSLLRPRFGGRKCPGKRQVRRCALYSCPVHCTMTSWKSWSKCTKTCGLGHSTTSRRVIKYGRFGGRACSNFRYKMRKCMLRKCPINCKTTGWSKFGDCSQGCGRGRRYAYRTVTVAPQHGGKSCPILRVAAKRACNTHKCPIHCLVGKWANWKKCSRSCGNGIMLRKRTTLRKHAHGGNRCPSMIEARVCNTHRCPTNCVMTPYSAFTSCSKSCGMGFKSRWRKVSQPALSGGKACPSTRQVIFCNRHKCPVNCNVGAFGKWTKCTKSCGNGWRRHTRKVSGGGYGGKKCPKKVVYGRCNRQLCPKDCQHGQWSGWSKCTKKCGGGTTTRTRSIISFPYAGGKKCGATVHQSKCQVNPCKIHCTVTPWAEFGACSKTCGSGKQWRHRNVMVRARHGGSVCPSLRSWLSCKTNPCPQDCKLSKWSGFGSCSVSCGHGSFISVMKGRYTGGKQFRRRNIVVKPMFGGAKCGAVSNFRQCNNFHCPRDCALGGWRQWKACSKTCGTGFQTRQLTVLNKASYGGKKCPNTTIRRACAKASCPRHCQVSVWSPLSKCTVSCSEVYKRVRSGRSNSRGKSHAHQSAGNYQLAKYGYRYRNRVVTLKPNKSHLKCPALHEKVRCNQYATCMAMFAGATKVTMAPKKYTWSLAGAKVHTEANGKARARFAKKTHAPTPYAVAKRNRGCWVNKKFRVSGWHGSGGKKNYCNLCKCNDGKLSCQKKDCAAIRRGTQCSHVKCKFVFSFEARHKVLMVTSHHSEMNGANHHCQYDLYRKNCACNCFGAGSRNTMAGGKLFKKVSF